MTQQSQAKLRNLIKSYIISEANTSDFKGRSAYKGPKFGKLIKAEAEATLSDEEKILDLLKNAGQKDYSIQDYWIDWYSMDVPVYLDFEILQDMSDENPEDYQKGLSKKRWQYHKDLKDIAKGFVGTLKELAFQEPIAGVVERGSQLLPEIVRNKFSVNK